VIKHYHGLVSLSCTASCTTVPPLHAYSYIPQLPLTATTGAGAGPVDVDRKATEDLAAMSNDRRQIVEALTEERAG
jgi:hypothetical protein